MTTQERIVNRTELVQNIFREVSGFPLESNFKDLVERLEKNYNQEFVSLAYEAASYKIALLNIGKNINIWNDFLTNYAVKHAVQVYIGLGWAVGRSQTPWSNIKNIVTEENLRYVADGIGFFYGTFKKRQAINQKEQFENLDNYNNFFDEGLGRSLWYSTKGELIKVKEIIDSFPLERQSDLWRGIGIAFTYAGGFDENTIKELEKYSGIYLNEVKTGALRVSKTRKIAGTLNNYTKLICSELCGVNIFFSPEFRTGTPSSKIE